MTNVVEMGPRVNSDLPFDEIPDMESFEMPAPRVGQAVVWYTTGFRDNRRASVGFVRYVGGRNVGLMTAGGQRVDAVRHIDDPKLKLNADQREMGAWDFTEDYKEIHRELQALRDEVQDLKKQKYPEPDFVPPVAQVVVNPVTQPLPTSASVDKPKKRRMTDNQLACSYLRRSVAAKIGKTYKDMVKYKLVELLELGELHGIVHAAEEQSKQIATVAQLQREYKEKQGK